MSIDYCLMLDCPPKQALGFEGLRGLLHDRARADQAVGHYTKAGDDRDAARRRRFEVTRDVRGRPVPVETSAAELYDRAAALDPHADKCADCPANLRQQAFGCYGQMAYPFPASAEEWLMKLPSDPKETLTGSLLAQAIYDNEYNGVLIAQMRERGKFFEREDAVEVEWGSGNDLRYFHSDQVLHALLANELVPPEGAFALLTCLNLLRLDGERIAGADDFRHATALLRDAPAEAAARLEFDLPMSAGRPPPEAGPLLEYLTTLFGSVLLQVPVSVQM